MEEPTANKGSKPPKDVMGMLEYYLVTKAPFQLPKGLKDWIVQWGPWIQLVLLILSLPLLLAVFAVSLAFLPFAAVTGGTTFTIGWVFLVIQVALEVMALPGLFARKQQGWTFAFYAVVVGAVSSLVYGNIFSALVNAIIGSYFLFQIKSYYK
jgi:hypothetical protein